MAGVVLVLLLYRVGVVVVGGGVVLRGLGPGTVVYRPGSVHCLLPVVEERGGPAPVPEVAVQQQQGGVHQEERDGHLHSTGGPLVLAPGEREVEEERCPVQ